VELHEDFVRILANILGLSYFFIAHGISFFLADLWHCALPKPDDDTVDAIAVDAICGAVSFYLFPSILLYQQPSWLAVFNFRPFPFFSALHFQRMCASVMRVQKRQTKGRDVQEM
jgi:hypothetical protein